MENDPNEQPVKIPDFSKASITTEAEDYVKKVQSGEIKPSAEDLKGFLPQTGVGRRLGSASRASDVAGNALDKGRKELDARMDGKTPFPADIKRVEIAALEAGEQQQRTDVQLATDTLLRTISNDSMFFRGMTIHKKITSGQEAFEIGQDGKLTDKGRMDAADYEYFYNHPSRNITFIHGAEEMLGTLGAEVGDTLDHLLRGDGTSVLNPYYKGKPNWESLQKEGNAFIMQGVQLKMSVSELKSGQVNRERSLHLAERQGRDPKDVHSERMQFLEIYKRYMNPPEYKDKDGKVVKPQPLFLTPDNWESAENKGFAMVESGARVLKGFYNLAFDASKDPLSWHGQAVDNVQIQALADYYERIKDDPKKQEQAKEALRLMSDPATIRAQRLNQAALDIADQAKWASGDNMILSRRSRPSGDWSADKSFISDPNVWSPGQVWTDPLIAVGLSVGAFRAIRGAAAAEASMAARYAAIGKLASLEAFTLDLATIAKQMSGMEGLLQNIGREAATAAGVDLATLTADQLTEMGLKGILQNPMGISPNLISVELIDQLTNAIPKPAAVAMTEEAWQLLPGLEKIKNLEAPAAFAGIPEGTEVWNKLTPVQRAQVIIGERTSEIYKLARKRQAEAIAAASAEQAAGVAAASANSNSSVARRSAGAATSAFGEYVMGGREVNNFFKHLQVAGLFNGAADLIEGSIQGGFNYFAPGTGDKWAGFLRDAASARFVGRTMIGVGAITGINLIDFGPANDSPLIKYPRYIANGLGFIVGARALGVSSQNIGRFMQAWGDEIARGDPTLWRGYANKIAKNPAAYGFDPADPFGPQAVASLMAKSGGERMLRFGKRALYDFGLKGGGIAELMVYGKDRDSAGQGFAIGTAFSAVGYYMGMGINSGLGRSRVNAMRADAMFRIQNTAEGDPTNLLNYVKAHQEAVKGGFEEDFLGFVLGVDNSTKGRVRFIDGKTANLLRFAYDYGLKDQAEGIRRQVALGFRTPEDIIGARLKQEEVAKIATDLRNKLAEESRTLDLEFEQQRDVARQLKERLADPRLTKEEKIDIGTQRLFVQGRIGEIQTRKASIKESLKQNDNFTFIRDQGVNLDTLNARVRAGVNEVTGNPLITFKGLTIETTKDGPLVYMNIDRMTNKALWHEAAEAVLLAGGVESVVGDATRVLFGNVAKNPGQLKTNKEKMDAAIKENKSVDTFEFFTQELGAEASMGAVLAPEQIARMIRAHRESANLDAAWEANAFAAVREYMTTGNTVGISNLTREIMANYVGLHLESTRTAAGIPNKLALHDNGSWGMTLYGFSERVLNVMKRDTALNLEGRAQIAGVTDNFLGGAMAPQNIRSFFIDPATGKRITITALERLSREAIKRSNKYGIDEGGRALVDLRKMQPTERRAWVTANNVQHWVNEQGELRDPKEIVQIEAQMLNPSIIALEEVRQQAPGIVRGVKKVTKTKDGETHTVSGNISAPEIHAMLQNPDLPENVKQTLIAYSKAVFKSDGSIGLMQGMYSGESKEVVYTPMSTPKLREWGSPLLSPEHRSLLPLSLTISWDTDASGAVKAARVSVNGLDWGKGIEPRVRIAAGSDLAKAHGITMSDLYGYMREYITNLNKGTGNKDANANAIPSAKLFDPTGNNPERGRNIRDLMHFIFDFQKKKGDAYVNQPADWGELGLRGPTHPYTTFRAERWVGPEADADGRFIRVNEQAYELSQGNFMGALGDNEPPKKLNRADVGEQTPEKEAEALRAALGPDMNIPNPTETGKVIDPTLPIQAPEIMGVISDIYSLKGDVIPQAVLNFIKDKEADIVRRAPQTVYDYTRLLEDLVREDLNRSGKGYKAQRERAKYVERMIGDLGSRTFELAQKRTGEKDATKNAQAQATAEARRAELAAETAAAETVSFDPKAPKQTDVNVATPMTEAVKKDLANFNEQIGLWREHVDFGLKDEAEGAEMSIAAAELPFYKKELRKYLDKAFAIKPDFDPGFDVYKYFPDYQKPDVRADVQATIDAEAAAVRQAQAANRPTATGDVATVKSFKDKTTDVLTKLAIMREPGSREIPYVIKKITGKNGIAGSIADILLSLEKNSPETDYINISGVTGNFSNGLATMIDAALKAEQGFTKAGNKEKAQYQASLRTQLEVLKNTVDGINEYATGIADTAPSRQAAAGAAKPKVSLADRQVYENGAVITRKDAPWVEGIPTKIEEPLGAALLKLADEVINVEGAGLDARQTDYFYKKFKAAKDAGVTAEQFWTMYEFDDPVSRNVIKYINDVAVKKDGVALFPYVGKNERPNLLAPEDVALKAIADREKKGGKPKKPAAQAEPAPTAPAAPIEQFGDVFFARTDKDAPKNIFYMKNKEALVVRNADGSFDLYKGMQREQQSKLWSYKTEAELMADYKARLSKGLEAEVNTPKPPVTEPAPATNVELQKLLINFAKDFKVAHRWEDSDYMDNFKARVKELYDAGGTKDDVIKKLGLPPLGDVAGHIGYVFTALEKEKNAKPKPKRTTAAEPAPTAQPKFDDKTVRKELKALLDEFDSIDEVEGDTTDVETRMSTYIQGLINQGVSKDVLRKLFDKIDPNSTALHLAMSGDQTIPTAKPKPKSAPAPELSPQLAPTTEPTTTGKPTWDAKKANGIASKVSDLVDKWEDAYGDDGDTASIEGRLYDNLQKLIDMGMKRSEIEALLGDAETSEGSIGSFLDDNAPDETPAAASGGAKPPKTPKPTAQGADAGDDAPTPKPKVPRQPDFKVPDGPELEDAGYEFEWYDPKDPKKDPNNLRKVYGMKARAEIDKRLAVVLDGAEKAVKEASDMVRKGGKGADYDALLKAYNNLELALAALDENAGASIESFGIDFFDMSPKVRERFGEIFNMDTREWWSKPQETRERNIRKQATEFRDRMNKISTERVMNEMLLMIGSEVIEKTGDPKKGNYQTKQMVLSKKGPWVMADDRTLLPLTNRLDDFLVTERLVDPDTKTGAVGTGGLIFIDTKAKTTFGEPAHINIMNRIMGTEFYGYRSNGFLDFQVLNANGDMKAFRISTQGTRGMTPAQLKKAYAEAIKRQQANKEGNKLPALQFDQTGTSFQANKEGLLLMNAEIAEFLRAGQLKKDAATQTQAQRQQVELRKQSREAEARAKETARQQAEAKKQEEATLRLGLFGRQPLDPNNPMTAMSIVTGEKKVVSRRADNLVEVREQKASDGSRTLKVFYTGIEFGGPREVLQTVSSKAAMELAQAFDPFTGYREAILNMIEGFEIKPDGPYPDKDGKPTNDPRLAASLVDILKQRDEGFADLITRIRASGTFGVLDVGKGEFLVVPKKSIRDKNGNLDMSQQVKLTRRLILKAQELATTAETQAQQRRQANATPPPPRVDPTTGRPPQPGAKPQPAAAPAPGLDVAAYMNERMQSIVQTARNTQGIARAEAASTVVRILSNKDNFKLTYMKDGKIKVYAPNNNLLAITDDEEEAFSWLTK